MNLPSFTISHHNGHITFLKIEFEEQIIKASVSGFVDRSSLYGSC